MVVLSTEHLAPLEKYLVKKIEKKFMKVIMASVNTSIWMCVDVYVDGGNDWLTYEHLKQSKTASLTLT